MKKIFLTSFIALGLIACNDSDEGINNGGSPTGNTYASISVSLKNQTRALDDSQKDDNGTALEQELVALDVLSTAGNKVFTAGAAGTDGKFWFETPNYITAPWATTAGNQTLALLFNKNGITAGDASATGAEVYEGTLAGLISPNFTMTSKGFAANILPNITKDEAAAGTGADKNVFTGIEVERVVAKGIVREGANFSADIKEGTTVVATVDSITFAAVNGATKTYLYRDNAGSRTMTEADDNQYAGFKSVIDGIAPIQNDAAAVAAGLVRLGVAGVPTDVSTAKAINAKGTEASDATDVFYFMENSGDVWGTDMKAKGFYRFAYAKVYATYTPASIMTKDGDVQNLVPGTSGKYYIKNTDGTYAEAQSTDAGAVEGYLVWKLKSGTIAKGVTFYKGAKDGVLYDSKEAAASSLLAPGQSAYTYTNGRCGYRALWNRQITDDSDPYVVVNASARRNNTYMLDIDGFAKLGFPWDESDPNDPNLPKTDPEDPNLPDPTDPNIEKQDTYMRVEAVVLPWNLVNRGGIILE